MRENNEKTDNNTGTKRKIQESRWHIKFDFNMLLLCNVSGCITQHFYDSSRMVGGTVFGIDNRFSGRRSILRAFVHSPFNKIKKA